MGFRSSFRGINFIAKKSFALFGVLSDQLGGVSMATALITGTSTGIGRATAIQMARKGYDVFATMRDPVRSTELGEVAASEGLPIKILPLDVDSDESVDGAVREILSLAGRIDVLVNNAGVGLTGPIEEMPLSEIRQVMETNFFGALRCVKAVLPSMRENGSGCIINVTSVAGRIASAAQGAYSSSKWALEAASEILAQEIAQFGIRVFIVEPGIVQTPIFGKMGTPKKGTRYSHTHRLHALFSKSNEDPVSPSVVAEKIESLAGNGHDKLRHPVGPDAEPFLAWRRSMSDEEWVAFGAADDETWRARIHRDFGLTLDLN